MGEVIGAGELHKGVKLLIDGEPWEITEFSFSKPVRWMFPLVVLAWETFWETTLANQTKIFVVKN